MNQIAAIVADTGAEAPFGLVGSLIDQDVVGLRRADAVIHDLLVLVQRLETRLPSWFGIAAVEEALFIGSPRQRR